MKSYNIYFEDIRSLDEYINKTQSIKKSDSLLIQIFSGLVCKETLQELISFLKITLPNSKIIGCTTSGEIISDKVTDEKVVISFTTFEKSTLEISYVQNLDKMDSYEMGNKLSKQLLDDKSKVFILFASGLKVNGEEFLNGVKDEAKDITVAGGLAGDNGAFKQTYLIYDDKILEHSAVGVSINSDCLQVTKDYSLAWTDIGKTFTVTKAEHNTVYEIDGVNTQELYMKYLGDEITHLLPSIGIEFPLIIQKDDGTKVARATLSVNEDGSFNYAGNVPEGSQVKFGVGNLETLLHGSAKVAFHTSRVSAQSIFIYSCIARKIFLGNESYRDIKNFSSISDVAGFFTYGEFYTSKKNLSLLNQTMTLLALSEDETIHRKINIEDTYQESNDIIRQNALSNLVNRTSLELEDLNNHLEEQVEIKTQKLESLNSDLKKKVQEEVDKNRQKDIKLFEQAKMGQMNEMLKNIAHQWRQPLSIISTVASGIKLNDEYGMLEKDEVGRGMNLIVDNTEKLSETIDSMVDLISKDESENIHVYDEVHNTISMMKRSLDSYRIQLEKRFDSFSDDIMIARGELPHVLMNIINNAKETFEQRNIQDRKITIYTQKEDKEIYLHVQDNAGGIPDEVFPKIFDPYFTTKHQSQGTGLGLHLCQKIVRENLGGHLYAENLDDGARFTIKIPL